MMKINKYVLYVISVGLFSVLLTACTLVLDQPADRSLYAEDSELVGFDEPYTQHTDYGDVTFQYSENTDILKAKALEYLIKVEDDTVLYFRDDMPEELLIQPGRYVSKGCCHEIPYGLCSRVESVEHLLGMYRMVTSPADQEDVFDVLDMNLDFEYTPHHSLSMPDPEYLAEHGMSVDSFIITDFDYLDEKVDLKTRTGTDVVDYSQAEKDTEITEENTDELVDIINLNTSNTDNPEFFRAPIKYLKDKGFDFGLDIKQHVRKKITHVVKIDSNDKDKTYRKETTVDNSYYLYEISMQYSKDFGSEASGGTQDPKKVYEMFSDLIDDAVAEQKADAKQSKLVIMVAIPIPSTPALCFFCRIAPMYELEIGIIGKVVIKHVPPKIISTVETIGKKEINKSQNKPKKEGGNQFSLKEINAAGYAKIGGGVEITMGVGTSVGFCGLGLGLYISANLVANLEGNIYGDSDEMKLSRSYVEFFVSVNLVARLLLESFSTKWTVAELGKLLSLKLGYFPVLDGGDNKATCVNKAEGNGEYYKEFEAQYSFANLGIVGNILPKEVDPFMFMQYTANDGEQHVVMMQRTDYRKDKKGIFKDLTYKFKCTSKEMLEGAKNFKTYPGFTFRDHIYTFPDARMEPQQTDEPGLTLVGLYLTKKEAFDENVEPIGEFDFVSEPKIWRYTIVVRARLTNGSKMFNCWNNWGVKLYASSTAFDGAREVTSVNNKSGLYDFVFHLYTTSHSTWGVKAHLMWDWKKDYPGFNYYRDYYVESEDLWIGPDEKVTVLDNKATQVDCH